MIFHNIQYDFYHLKLGVGQGLNTRAKLLALWGLLVFANILHYDKLQIANDSKIVLIGLITSATCRWWLWIQALKETFQEVKIMHIYREFNSKACALSKTALDLDDDMFSIQHFVHGSLVQEETINIF